MGGISSKTFSEMVEEDDGVGTPQKPHRVVDQWQDPRSPTVDITRTPIQVEKTPEKVLDPRSPTSGITRTPIQSYMVQPGSEKVLNINEENVENPPISDPADPSAVAEAKQELAKLNLDDSHDPDPKDESEQPESEALVELLLNDAPESETNKEEKEPKKKTDPRNVPGFQQAKSTNTKAVFHSHTNQQPTSNSDVKKVTRSPLKVIDTGSPRSQAKYDTNSPRAIVQRKQASKIGILQNPARRKFNLGSPTKYNQLKEHDKEN